MSDLVPYPVGAEILGIKEQTLRIWVMKKMIPHVKIGRRVFFLRSDLEAYIDACYVEAENNALLVRKEGN